MHRFFHPHPLSKPDVRLTGDEANHLARVLRLTAGARVEVFDGDGNAAAAEVLQTDKRSATLRILELRPAVPRLQPALTLLTAAPKADRLRWLAEKATELGVERLCLVQTQRSVVHPGGGKVEKMQAAVVAACKQCGRNDLMQIVGPQGWEAALDATAADRLLIASPGGVPMAQALGQLREAGRVAVAIGPEGGFSEDEVERARERDALTVDLGPTILRIETAGIAVASAIRFWGLQQAVTSS